MSREYENRLIIISNKTTDITKLAELGEIGFDIKSTMVKDNEMYCLLQREKEDWVAWFERHTSIIFVITSIIFMLVIIGALLLDVKLK